MAGDKVIVENVNVPGQTSRLDKAKYDAMRDALLNTLPVGRDNSMTVKGALATLRIMLPEDLFPGGKTSGWWQKTVQLDLEAKGLVGRTDDKPMRIFRIG
ncbi:MAG: hypothetical protein AAF764_07580 [Pseudomonadota bacterium]